MSVFHCFVFALVSLTLSIQVESTSSLLPPVYIDIHKREVNGTTEFVYGSFIGIGNPHQNQSLWPSIVHNETYLTANSFCDNVDSTQCNATITGGMVIIADDEIFKKVEDYQPTDALVNNASTSSLLVGTDTIHLYQLYFESDGAWETNVTNMPVVYLQNGSFDTVINNTDHPSGLVGLGPRSTLLDSLYSDNLIASKSYSLYIGTGYPRAGGDINGSLTIGGYDSSRFTSNISTYNLTANPSDGNPFRITIQQMTLNSQLGNSNISINLLDSDDAENGGFTASLTTEQYPLTLPPTTQQRLLSILNASLPSTSSPDTSSEDTITLPSSFNGTLTITLSSDLTITIPQQTLSLSTQQQTPDSSTNVTTPISTSTTPPNTAIFGTSFLSQIYLMVSYPNSSSSTTGQFFISPAIKSAPYITTTTWQENTTPKSYSQTAPNISTASRMGLPGAIVGGVVGGGAIAVLVFCFVRHHLRNIRDSGDDEPRKGRVVIVRFLMRTAGNPAGVGQQRKNVVLMDEEQEFDDDLSNDQGKKPAGSYFDVYTPTPYQTRFHIQREGRAVPTGNNRQSVGGGLGGGKKKKKGFPDPSVRVNEVGER